MKMGFNFSKMSQSDKISAAIVIAALVIAPVFLGVYFQDIGAGLSFIPIGLFIGTLWLVSCGRRSQHKPVRWLSQAFLGLAIGYFIVSLTGVAERMYLYKADNYPRWLASGSLGDLTYEDIFDLRKNECKVAPVDIIRKSDYVVLRCGVWWFMPSTKTYIATLVERP